MNDAPISIAIETTCRQGGVALGMADQLIETRELGPTARHAAGLLPALDSLLDAHRLAPGDLTEVYVSVGPGSFTGIRVGVTVARTLAQAHRHIRLVAVPTARAVAQAVIDQPWTRLAVVMAAKLNTVHATLMTRPAPDGPITAAEPLVDALPAMLDTWAKPITLIGEGLGYCDQDDLPSDVTVIAAEHWLPGVQHVWQVGQSLAGQGQYTSRSELLPLYARAPEAIRLWEKRHGQA